MTLDIISLDPVRRHSVPTGTYIRAQGRADLRASLSAFPMATLGPTSLFPHYFYEDCQLVSYCLPLVTEGTETAKPCTMRRKKIIKNYWARVAMGLRAQSVGFGPSWLWAPEAWEIHLRAGYLRPLRNYGLIGQRREWAQGLELGRGTGQTAKHF